MYVSQMLPKLRFLDSKPLTKAENQSFVALTHTKQLKLWSTKVVDGLSVFQPSSKEGQNFDAKQTFGKLRYCYSGKYSEGNRFITNKDL